MQPEASSDAYDDWCILQALQKAGASADLQQLYAERAMNYRKLYDPSIGWMRGRRQDGFFQSPFSIFKWGDAFTEVILSTIAGPSP